MSLIIFGSEGNVGHRLMAAWPGAIGIDRTAGADIVADLETIDYTEPRIAGLLADADGVIHVATSADVRAPDEVQFQAVTDAARLLQACQRVPVPRVILPSSDWADPKRGWENTNPYGHSKRVFETMADMYRFSTGQRCVALRIGWVARPGEYEKSDGWLRANYWSTERLLAEIATALGPMD